MECVKMDRFLAENFGDKRKNAVVNVNQQRLAFYKNASNAIFVEFNCKDKAQRQIKSHNI